MEPDGTAPSSHTRQPNGRKNDFRQGTYPWFADFVR